MPSAIHTSRRNNLRTFRCPAPRSSPCRRDAGNRTRPSSTRCGGLHGPDAAVRSAPPLMRRSRFWSCSARRRSRLLRIASETSRACHVRGHGRGRSQPCPDHPGMAGVRRPHTARAAAACAASASRSGRGAGAPSSSSASATRALTERGFADPSSSSALSLRDREPAGRGARRGRAATIRYVSDGGPGGRARPTRRARAARALPGACSRRSPTGATAVVFRSPPGWRRVREARGCLGPGRRSGRRLDLRLRVRRARSS